jgi:hypothetical protein
MALLEHGHYPIFVEPVPFSNTNNRKPTMAAAAAAATSATRTSKSWVYTTNILYYTIIEITLRIHVVQQHPYLLALVIDILDKPQSSCRRRAHAILLFPRLPIAYSPNELFEKMRQTRTMHSTSSPPIFLQATLFLV